MSELLLKTVFDTLPEEQKIEMEQHIKNANNLSAEEDLKHPTYMYVIQDMLLGVVNTVLATADMLDEFDVSTMPEEFKLNNKILDSDLEAFNKGYIFAKSVTHKMLFTDDTIASLIQALKEHVTTD